MRQTIIAITALLLMLLTLPASADNPELKEVKLTFSPEIIDVSAGIEVNVIKGSPERIEIRSKELDQIICEPDPTTGAIKLGRKMKLFDGHDAKCTALIVTAHPDLIKKINCSSGSSLEMDREVGHLGKKLELTASSGAEIDIRSDGHTLIAKASSGSEIEVHGDFHYLKASSGSGSDIEVIGRYDEAEFSVSSGSDIEASGEAKMVRATASSFSDFSGVDLITKEADLKASSGADISLTCTGRCDKTESSGGDIRVHTSARH